MKSSKIHTHSFTYTANGATITATCGANDCYLIDNKALLTIIAPAKTSSNDTNSAAATLTGLADFNTATGNTVAEADIKYFKATKSGTTYTKIGDAQAAAPTDVGNYIAEITVENKTARVGYTITYVVPESDCLTFTAEKNSSSVTVYYATGTLQYKTNNDDTWRIYTNGTKIPLNKDDYVRFCGTGVTFGLGNHIWIGGQVACSGNVMSLRLNNFEDWKDAGLCDSCFEYMFYNCTGLTETPSLPATTLADYCYSSMFYNCTGLTETPELPATTLANKCYSDMFYHCTGLTETPELPATTLANKCYSGMFTGCTGLTEAPALPATTLADGCYARMFSGCTGIKLSETQNEEYNYVYKIPSGDKTISSVPNSALNQMFSYTGGTFTGTPNINTAYYMKSNNIHTHSFTYTADGATITATCGLNKCYLTNNNVALTIIAPEKTIYGDTNSAAATLTGLYNFNSVTGNTIEKSDIKYYKAIKSGTAYTKTGNALTAAPTNAGDYVAEITVRSKTASVGYTIAPKDMSSIVPSFSNLTYNGTLQTPVINTPIKYGNYTLVNGTDYDIVPLSTDMTNVGTKTVNVVYKGNFGGNISKTFSITQAKVTITSDNATKTYDGTALTKNTFTSVGLAATDTHTFTVVMTEASTITHKGTQPNVIATVDGVTVVAGTETSVGNYLVTASNGTLTINPANVTITIDNKSSKYKADIAELTYTSSGIIAGDDLGIQLSTTATKASEAGEYDITATWNNNPDYTVTVNKGKYTITKTDLTVSASGYSGTYDGNAHSISVDVIDSNAVVFYGTSELTADNYKTVGNTINPKYTNAGNYIVYYYIKTENYEPDLVYGSKTVNIAKAKVKVTADAKSKIYGKTDPELTYKATGLIGEDTMTGKLTRAKGENVDTYAITQGTLTAGKNYDITFTGADFTINKSVVTITAENKSSKYGEDIEELSYHIYGNYVDYNDLGIQLSTTATKTSKVGEYDITATWNNNPNYTATLKNGKYTITKANVKFTAPTANELTANDKVQALVTSGETRDGKIVYAVIANNENAPAEDEYFETIPTAIDPGTYYVWYKVIADENHNDSEPACISVTLADENWLLGDVNNDGKINITDITIVAAHAKGKKMLSKERFKRADVNLDGTVNITDVIQIAAHVKGKKMLVQKKDKS
ncbi:MBG domain-containing protein [Ruminococcus albus]|nr:MBG domain-containing protein [Ruminococcus albus]